MAAAKQGIPRDAAPRDGKADPPTAIGAIVMAMGIFAAAGMQRLPGGPDFTRPMAAIIAVTWALIALSLLRSIAATGIARHTEPVIGSFGIGTWIAATALLARMAMLALPNLVWLARAIFLLTLGLWLWFIPGAVRKLGRIAADSQIAPNGIILLATVATQAVALIALRLFSDLAATRWVVALLLALGVLCYLGGLPPILRRYVTTRDWRLATDWENGNCILHGALSITGLTAVASGFFGAPTILSLWLVVLAIVVFVEAIEIARLRQRVCNLGWRRGVFTYDVSQWSRNFTFGMFYAFTLAFAETVPLAATQPALSQLRAAILAGGPFVVLALLLVETGLLASQSFTADREEAAP